MSKKSSTFAPAFEKEQHGGHSSVGRASDCGSECRGFEPHSPPQRQKIREFKNSLFFVTGILIKFTLRAGL